MRTPVKAQVSLFRQRALLTLRYCFRLPIDDVTDAQRAEIDRKVSDVLAAQARMIKRLEARLRFYEKNVPSIRRAHQTFAEREARVNRPADLPADVATDRTEQSG